MGKIANVIIFAAALGVVRAIVFPQTANLAKFTTPPKAGIWILFEYLNATHLREAHFSETSGIKGLASAVDDAKIQYALINVKANGSVRSLYIVWTGPNVSAADKKKASGDISEVAKGLAPFYKQLTCSSKENINEANVIAHAGAVSISNSLDK